MSRIKHQRIVPVAVLVLLFGGLAFGFNHAFGSAAKVTIQQTQYKGWKHNLKISNGAVELIVTLDVGPRIIRYGYPGEPNVFKEFDEQIGKSGEESWQIRGGHRLWHAPEEATRTYALDNTPILYEKLSDSSVRLTQSIEAITGIQKQIDLTLSEEGTGVTVVHRLKNSNLWDVELAPWALTVMAQGGTAIIPLPEKIAHPGSLEPGEKPDYRGFAANQMLIVWPFTDLADPRWRFGTRYITLSQDRNAKKPTKLGLAHKMGWIGYLNGGTLFVKSIDYQEGRTYTDGGSNFETFTNKDFLEVESLGPLQRIPAGGAIEHVERWHLIKGLPSDTSDAGIDSAIRPRVEALLK